MTRNEPFRLEGVDYTIEGLKALRVELISIRDESMNQWPDAIEFTVVMSHTIAVLAYFIEKEEMDDRAEAVIWDGIQEDES